MNHADGGTWTEFYYDQSGRILEEYQDNGVIVNGCQAYDIVDHIYLLSSVNEVARDVRRFQSDGGGCSSGYYSFVDEDLRYVHEDYRNSVFAVEAKAADGGGLVWEGETDPFGVTIHEGLPGSDGKIGTSDDLPYLDPETFGRAEAYRDPEFTNLANAQTAAISIPIVDRATQAIGNIFTLSGMSSYGASPVGFGASSSIGAGNWSLPGGFGSMSLSGSSGMGAGDHASGDGIVGGAMWATLGLAGTLGASATPSIPVLPGEGSLDTMANQEVTYETMGTSTGLDGTGQSNRMEDSRGHRSGPKPWIQPGQGMAPTTVTIPSTTSNTTTVVSGSSIKPANVPVTVGHLPTTVTGMQGSSTGVSDVNWHTDPPICCQPTLYVNGRARYGKCGPQYCLKQNR
jgi:hypothetical protein